MYNHIMRTSGKLLGEVLVCAVLAAIFAWLILPAGGEKKNKMPPEARLARDNLRQLLIAVERYRDVHGGNLPHDERGPDYALYLLRRDLDAAYLACGPVDDPAQLPVWDDAEHRARNGGWDYLNVADPWQIPPTQIIVASRPREFPATIYFGDRTGSIGSRRVMSRDEGRALLGSCFSMEGFLVASKDVLEDWERLGPKGSGWQRTSTGTGIAVRTMHPGKKFVYEYDYEGKRLLARRIRCGGRQILERVLLDKFGGIRGVERAPDDWRNIWRECEADRAK